MALRMAILIGVFVAGCGVWKSDTPETELVPYETRLRNIVERGSLSVAADFKNPHERLVVPPSIAECYENDRAATLETLMGYVRNGPPEQAIRAGSLATALRGNPLGGAFLTLQMRPKQLDQPLRDGRTYRAIMIEMISDTKP